MIVSELRAAVRAMTGDAEGVIWADADILRYLNWAQYELTRKSRAVQSVISGAQTLTNFDVFGGILLPADFIAELAVYFGSPLNRLQRMDYSDFWEQSPATPGSGTPTQYTITNFLTGAQVGKRHMLFYPVMTPGLTNQIVRIEYKNRPVILVNDADIPQLPEQYHELMVLVVCRRCFMQNSDFQSAGQLKNEVETYFMQLESDLIEQSDLHSYTMQGTTADYSSNWGGW